MAVPDFQTLMLPLLRCAERGRSRVKDCLPDIIAEFDLTDADVEEMLPSGRQPTLYNRLHWARTYLGKAGLLESERRGVFNLSKAGAAALSENPTRIDMRYLQQFQPYQAWQEKQNSAASNIDAQPVAPIAKRAVEDAATPDDRIAAAVTEMETALADELLASLLDGSPAFF